MKQSIEIFIVVAFRQLDWFLHMLMCSIWLFLKHCEQNIFNIGSKLRGLSILDYGLLHNLVQLLFFLVILTTA